MPRPEPTVPAGPWLHLWMLQQAQEVAAIALRLLRMGSGGAACGSVVDAVERSEMALQAAVEEIKAARFSGPNAACPRCAASLWLVWRHEPREAWVALCTNENCANYREPVWLSGAGCVVEVVA